MNTPEGRKTNTDKSVGRDTSESKPHFTYKTKLIADKQWRLLKEKKESYGDTQRYEKAKKEDLGRTVQKFGHLNS